MWNFVARHNSLDGFGGMGEGMSRCEFARDGSASRGSAHESAPKNFTAVDVSDPRAPKIVARADLPQSQYALQLAGDGRRHPGDRLPERKSPACSRPASNCSTSVPETPKRIALSTSRAEFARRPPAGFADGEYTST
jgi:hypothetical protein